MRRIVAIVTVRMDQWPTSGRLVAQMAIRGITSRLGCVYGGQAELVGAWGQGTPKPQRTQGQQALRGSKARSWHTSGNDILQPGRSDCPNQGYDATRPVQTLNNARCQGWKLAELLDGPRWRSGNAGWTGGSSGARHAHSPPPAYHSAALARYSGTKHMVQHAERMLIHTSPACSPACSPRRALHPAAPKERRRPD